MVFLLVLMIFGVVLVLFLLVFVVLFLIGVNVVFIDFLLNFESSVVDDCGCFCRVDEYYGG